MASSVPKIEEVVLDKGTIGLGFNIRGGTDNIHVGSDPGIFVTTIRPSGAAAKDGRLAAGDKILEINGNDLREVTHQTAVNYFHEAEDTVKLLVERGAETRIRSQLSSTISTEDESPEPSGAPLLAHKSEISIRRQGSTVYKSPYLWLSLTALAVGGIVAFWLFRRRRL